MSTPDDAFAGIDVVEQMRRQIIEAARLPGTGASRSAASGGPGILAGGTTSSRSTQTLPGPGGVTQRLWIFGYDPYPTDDSFYFGDEPLDSDIEDF